MTGYPVVFEEDLYGVVSEAHIDLFLDELIRDAVVVVVNFNMVIDIYSGLFPFAVLVGMRR